MRAPLPVIRETLYDNAMLYGYVFLLATSLFTLETVGFWCNVDACVNYVINLGSRPSSKMERNEGAKWNVQYFSDTDTNLVNINDLIIVKNLNKLIKIHEVFRNKSQKF